MKGNNAKIKLDFVGIGAPKCATSWVHQCLKEHPQICFVSQKDNLKDSYLLSSKDPSLRQCQKKTKGEFAAEFLYHKDAIRKIKENNPDMKIIAVLRNPADRAFSSFRWKSALEKGGKDFETFLKENPWVIKKGFYGKRLKEFFNTFPRENILVLIYEDIKKNPVGFIQEIYKFLGVSNTFTPPSAKIRIYPTGILETKTGKLIHNRLTPLLNKYSLGKAIKTTAPIRYMYYKLAPRLLAPKNNPTISPETRKKLLALYAEDIRSIEKLINRDLSFWK